MFCSNCGSQINENAIVCIKCGCATQKYILSQQKSSKDIGVAYLLWFFLGYFGGHRFYLGKTKSAIIMLICSIVSWFLSILILPLLAMFIWWIVDTFLIPNMINDPDNTGLTISKTATELLK
ncbi:hypothetical protein fh0823_13800 [Francisella halioticida]|uniref:TM2 domain-containing protein n=1 Tax=Francisella halioticida TaxID=549298 RepID=A0ABN5AY01_9GAMM|nr:TM2 domain-containing protein [Francisella halioticida]ASG68379.1 hypothetical protein CDV26_08240 [Francisella halioticida]BCD91241.1 hypothetical protein fh0823_13800 [Francisella halioticida]